MFLLRWMGANLLGWTVGVFVGFSEYLEVFEFSPSLSRYLPFEIVDPMSISLIIGASIGAAQLLMLKMQISQRAFWVIATSLAWGILVATLTWYHDNYFPERLKYGSLYEIIFYVVGLVLVGACVGLAQSWVAVENFPPRASWIWANTIGYLVSIISYVFVLVPVFLILLLYYETGYGGSTKADEYGTYLSIVTIPLFGTISSLVTGIIFLKHADHLENSRTSNSEIAPSD